MLEGVTNLTDQFCLSLTNFSFTCDGMAGFIKWAKDNQQEEGAILTTLIHDLAEFARNREEKWFCPRTYSYSKYLS
jgi:hypothetical protein